MEIFSVIILSYNNSEFLIGSIDSVLIQDYSDIELIVADDCSQSFDAEYFKEYCLKNKKENLRRVLIYSNPENFGTVKNANTAISKAEGTYFKIIGGDDQLGNGKTLTNAAKALANSEGGLITSDVIKCDAQMNVVGKYPDRLQKKLNSLTAKQCFDRLCIHNDIIDGGVFIRRDFFEKYGVFDERYRLLEDWPMWLKATYAGCKIEYVPFVAMKYRSDGGIGTSTNPVYMADKVAVLKNEIIPRKKELGIINYSLARISFSLINNMTIRKLYAFLVGRKTST